MLPDNPWIMGGGKSTFVLVEGEDIKRRYIEWGCNKDKIIVTGRAAHDYLFEGFKQKQNIRDRLFKKYHFNQDVKLILVALPQYAEEGLLSWEKHLNEINFIGSIYQQLNANCLISLHPRMERNNYLFLEKEYSLVIAEEPLSDILPAADIFTATYSSTVPWAVLCQIPTVVFDFLDFGYESFNYPGTIIVKDKEKYNVGIRKIIE